MSTSLSISVEALESSGSPQIQLSQLHLNVERLENVDAYLVKAGEELPLTPSELGVRFVVGLMSLIQVDGVFVTGTAAAAVTILVTFVVVVVVIVSSGVIFVFVGVDGDDR